MRPRAFFVMPTMALYVSGKLSWSLCRSHDTGITTHFTGILINHFLCYTSLSSIQSTALQSPILTNVPIHKKSYHPIPSPKTIASFTNDMSAMQMHELGRILNHLRENAPPASTDNGSRTNNAYEEVGSKQADSDGNKLDDDHPYSSKWPEVFSNGREVYSEQFYSQFPFLQGVDPFDTDNTYMSSEAYLTSNAAADPPKFRKGRPDRTAEVPPALAFVNGLISLELDDLPIDDQDCLICRESYRGGEFEEMPLELPGCGHVVGRDCLLTWLSTFPSFDEGMQRTSCPHCRRETPIENRMSIDTSKGLAQLLRDANYLLTGSGPFVLDRKARRKWEIIKRYANNYLEERRLYDRDHALLEQKRKMNERKVEIFMKLMKDHIAEYVKLAASGPGKEQEKNAGSLVSNLHWFERRGLIEAYLDLKDGTYTESGDINLTIEEMNAELATLRYPLAQMMDWTYSRTLA